MYGMYGPGPFMGHYYPGPGGNQSPRDHIKELKRLIKLNKELAKEDEASGNNKKKEEKKKERHFNFLETCLLVWALAMPLGLAEAVIFKTIQMMVPALFH